MIICSSPPARAICLEDLLVTRISKPCFLFFNLIISVVEKEGTKKYVNALSFPITFPLMDSVIELGERNRSPQQSLVPGEEWDFDIVSNTTLGLPNHPGNEARNESSLAPVDTGFGAWAFVGSFHAAFLVTSIH